MPIDQETIQSLYPDAPATETVQTEADEPTEDYGYEQPAESPNGNPYSLDSGTVENSLYGAEAKVTLSGETNLSVITPEAEQQANLRENLGYMASEVGASQNDMHDLVSHANKLLITGERAEPAQTMASLYDQHGAALSAKLDDARVLVSSFPELSEWLETTGAGDNCQIVSQIMRIAESPRAQARLKILRNK